MMKKVIIISMLAAIFVSCSSNSIKEKINRAGNIAGEATGEFVEGAADGVVKAFDVTIKIDEKLEAKGIQFGKSTVSNDSIGTDNLLVVYVIFNKDYQGKLIAKAFDGTSLEMGRSSCEIEGKKDEAKYIEVHFDKRTNLDSKNKITIE
jgi:hypothetical protein